MRDLNKMYKIALNTFADASFIRKVIWMDQFLPLLSACFILKYLRYMSLH